MQGLCSSEVWQASYPCVLPDRNCPKGRGKDELLAHLDEEGYVLLPKEGTMLWCFADWGRGDWYGADCMRLPLTFQDNVWLPADKKFTGPGASLNPRRQEVVDV